MNSRTQILIITIAILITVPMVASRSPMFATPTKEAISAERMATLRYYLELDHQDVSRKTLSQKQSSILTHALNEVLKDKNELESLLIETLQKGPTQQTIAYVEQTVGEEWAAEQAFLSDEKVFIRGAGAKKLLGQQQLSRSEFIRIRIAQLIQKYQENSALALAAIGTPNAVQALNEALKKESPDLRKVILDAARKYKHQLDAKQDPSGNPPPQKDPLPPSPPGGLVIQ